VIAFFFSGRAISIRATPLTVVLATLIATRMRLCPSRQAGATLRA
jgi:hypothetical protein